MTRKTKDLEQRLDEALKHGDKQDADKAAEALAMAVLGVPQPDQRLPCMLCGLVPRMVAAGALRCADCDELHWRIRNAPHLAREVLAGLAGQPSGNSKQGVFVMTERVEDDATGSPSRRTYWTKVGTAHQNRDGSTTLKLDALPLSGTLQVR